MPQDSSGATYRDMVLAGLAGGLGFGLLNAVLYLFFLFPMAAHHLFGTYLHYDADILGYAAAYVGVIGIMGMTIGLLAGPAIVKRFSSRRIARELMLQKPEFANNGSPEPK